MLSPSQKTGLVVKQLQVRHERMLNAALTSLGLTMVQWNALRQISRFPNASLHFLANENFQSDQAFGAVTARLVTRGLLTRKQGPGKVVLHEVTAAGRALFDEGSRLVDSVFNASFSVLSDSERVEFDRLLDLLHDRVDNQEQARDEIK